MATKGQPRSSHRHAQMKTAAHAPSSTAATGSTSRPTTLQAVGVDVDPSEISRIENQERLVTDLEIIAICESLDITVTSLFEEAPGA